MSPIEKTCGDLMVAMLFLFAAVLLGCAIVVALVEVSRYVVGAFS